MTHPNPSSAPEGVIPEARLREIIDGCEGATPGPWRTEVGNEGARGILAPQKPNGSSMVIADVYAWHEVVADNAAHIARLDPQTVASMARELLDLRAIMADRSSRAEGVEDLLVEWFIKGREYEQVAPSNATGADAYDNARAAVRALSAIVPVR